MKGQVDYGGMLLFLKQSRSSVFYSPIEQSLFSSKISLLLLSRKFMSLCYSVMFFICKLMLWYSGIARLCNRWVMLARTDALRRSDWYRFIGYVGKESEKDKWQQSTLTTTRAIFFEKRKEKLNIRCKSIFVFYTPVLLHFVSDECNQIEAGNRICGHRCAQLRF